MEIKINDEILQKYVDILTSIVSEDRNITNKNVAQVFYKISKMVECDQLFYSNMMFISIAVLLELLYRDDIIVFEKCIVRFKKDYCFQIKYIENSVDVLDNRAFFSQENLVREFIQSRNVTPNTLYYQSYDTFESLQRRQRVLQKYGDDEGKSILFLGDDELFCIYYALHSNAKRIAVLDIDDTIFDKVKEANSKFGLNIETYKCNILTDFPNELYNSFDTFFASGLKDFGGLLIFIYSGILTLNDNLESAGYFTYYNYNSIGNNSDFEYELQKKLYDNNLFFEFIAPCDQAMIPKNIIERLINKIKHEKYFINYKNNQDEINLYLRQDNVFAADPQFPLFSVKPIQLARIRRRKNEKILIERALKILKRFSKT